MANEKKHTEPDRDPDQDKKIPEGKRPRTHKDADDYEVTRAASILAERFADYLIIVRPSGSNCTIMGKWSNLEWAEGAANSVGNLLNSRPEQGE